MLKKILSFIMLLFIILTLFGCETKLELNGPDKVEVGNSIILTHNYGSGASIQWLSSDEDIAIVYEGMVIGVSEGNVTISLTINDETVQKVIEVIPNSVSITIKGVNKMVVGETKKLEAILSKDIDETVLWTSSDESILKVDEEGNIKARKVGIAVITASVYSNSSSIQIEVFSKNQKLNIEGVNKIEIGNSYQYKAYDSTGREVEVKWSIDDKQYGSISNDGIFTASKVGHTSIYAHIDGIDGIMGIFYIEITPKSPEQIIITCDKEIEQGKVNSSLKVQVLGEEANKEVIYKSSNPKVAIVYNNMILGITEGKTTITAYSSINEDIFDSIEIVVNKYKTNDPSIENLNRTNEIISKMTLSQKIGQMFVIGFSGTSMTNSLKNDIENYNFGNIIYMKYNVTNPDTLLEMSNSIQKAMVNYNTVPAFITIDQEGGRVARLTNGGTHFISNMAMAATGNPYNSYLEGLAMGKELSSYGINVDFAPVLDVNNNPENPIIGIRSYGDNPITVSSFGNEMIKGLKESNVMGCSKHFPGHGNTNVDSHYGLPTITSNIDELYQIELAPFISAISNGIDSIMTTHIIFTSIDEQYPATLSKKVITDLLRTELGYNGIIFTDGMEMGAVTNNFGGYDRTAILAVQAGVDILTYTSSSNPKTAHKALMNAVSTGEITEERINESVRRILLKKLEYGMLDNYIKDKKDISKLLEENKELNIKFAMESLTQVKGDFNVLDKSKSTLIISPETSYYLGEGLYSNSFANYASNYLLSKGHVKVDYRTVSVNITNTERTDILNIIKDYDQIVIAMSNVKTNGYSQTANLINYITKNNVIVIALDTPYDYMSYNSSSYSNVIKNYICVYGYQEASVIALSKYLNGEFEAQGQLPINVHLFN